jgi:hypothetical protein
MAYGGWDHGVLSLKSTKEPGASETINAEMQRYGHPLGLTVALSKLYGDTTALPKSHPPAGEQGHLFSAHSDTGKGRCLTLRR